MIKYIFSDMDGTLLDENSRIPEEFGTMLAKLKQRGVKFAIASGRQYWALKKQFEEFSEGFSEDMLFVAENGSYVGDAHKCFFSYPIDVGVATEIIRKVDNLPVKIKTVLCGSKRAYIRHDWDDTMEDVSRYYTQFDFVDDLAVVDDEIIKVALADLYVRDAENTFWPALEEFKASQQISLSSNVWIDVMAPDVNKGMAIKRLQTMLGVKPEECAAFGDYLNDLEMMDAVYYSYAMENAHPDLKSRARFVAKSNTEHGVIQAVNDMIAKGLI